MITVCVWLLIKAGRACKQRGNHVLGVGLHGGAPCPHGERSCSLQHLGEHYIGLQVVLLGRCSELDLGHLRLVR